MPLSPEAIREYEQNAMRQWYDKWPEVRCKPIGGGAENCGLTFGAFPDMVNNPCPQCVQHVKMPQGVQSRPQGVMVKLTVEELEPQLFV